ncbi:MAG: signal peptidase I [Lentisphaerae bacterium]|nr:signal peptidase I [Lentisphaerota bacterium]
MFKILAKRKLRRQLDDFRKQIRFILHADDDILELPQKETLKKLLDNSEEIGQEPADKIRTFLNEAQPLIVRNSPRFRSCRIRELLDVLAVACMVAFGIRGLFLQPFKIPTSSMQPTLFGIHYVEDKVIPNINSAAAFALYSAVPAKAEITAPGRLDLNSFSNNARGGNPLAKFFFGQTSFIIGDKTYTLPGTLQKVADYTALSRDQIYRPGEKLADGWLSMGDHLFVDRMSHHFWDFRRGDVVVFNTEGITDNGQPLAGFYYIKRLVGMPGDTLKIDGNQLLVKSKDSNEFIPVQELCQKFEKIYSGQGGYHGHLNQVGSGYGRFLGSPDAELIIPENFYFMLGDNSLFSSDSRVWGLVPRSNMVGRAFFVFWPFSRRWGLADSTAPLPVPTTESRGNSFPQMSQQ